jgi:hypothetical protein
VNHCGLCSQYNHAHRWYCIILQILLLTKFRWCSEKKSNHLVNPYSNEEKHINGNKSVKFTIREQTEYYKGIQ